MDSCDAPCRCPVCIYLAEMGVMKIGLLHYWLRASECRHICVLPLPSMLEQQRMNVWVFGGVEVDDMLCEFRRPLMRGNDILAGLRHAKQLCKVGLFPRAIEWHLQFVYMVVTANKHNLFRAACLPRIGSQRGANSQRRAHKACHFREGPRALLPADQFIDISIVARVDDLPGSTHFPGIGCQ